MFKVQSGTITVCDEFIIGHAGDATKYQITEVLDKEQLSTGIGGFCAAVSLNDGMVLQTTTSITDVLGFPKDMWHGRSFIDFVHPKDRETFTNKITSTVMLPFGDRSRGKPELKPGGVVGGSISKSRTESDQSGNFFCRLRMYNSLKAVSCYIFYLNTVKIHIIHHTKHLNGDSTRKLCKRLIYNSQPKTFKRALRALQSKGF